MVMFMETPDAIISNEIDFDLIQIRKYQPRKLTKNSRKQIFALDTETLHGSVKLIADNTGRFALNPDLESILEFMTYEKYRSAIMFFYNINYDANAIIKAFPVDNMRELYETGKTEIGEYSIFYIPRKLFRITKNKNVYAFYDIFQYYETSLERAARKFINKEKYINPIDTPTLGKSLKYWNDNLPAIIEYCINDCVLTAELGELLQTTLSDAIDIYPDSYISKAGLTKQYVRKCCDIPNVNVIPRNALKFAFNAYSGGRFEIIKKGNIGECSLFDIVSAYPFYIKSLLDVENGQWRETRCLHQSADYGFYLVSVESKYRKIAPLHYQLGNGTICYPVLNATMYLTKHELLEYEKYIDYEIISGWEFYSNGDSFPFSDYVDLLYKKKSETAKSDYKYNIYKILMNSLYGCFYEKIPSKRDNSIIAGKLFNPVYATMITAQTRIQLFKYALEYENDIVGFATDSVLIKGKPDLPIGKKLGDWDFETSGETVVLRTGIYQINEKIKSRGIRKSSNIITPQNAEYADLFRYIKSEPFRTKYPIVMNRPLSFIECLLHHNKHKISDINQFIDIEYEIDINTDYKRLWNDSFSCGIEIFDKCIDSKPLII